MDKDTLLGHLTSPRRHVLGIVEGLGDDEMRRAVLPSGWTPLQLLHHLAVDVERFWFRGTVAGEEEVVDAIDPDSDGGWTVPPSLTPSDAIALYRSEIQRADAIIAATDLDAAPAWWPDFFGDYRLADLGEVMLHVLTETATHAGHLDAVRELIDGRQWLVLD
ncbi:MAG: DinB family protein [Angustibacter sp.]